MAKWGEITWIFFHTLSMKTTEEQYTTNKRTLFDTIVTICQCLPCPECQQHATLYMKTQRPPETLNDFKKMLWMFHNVVNVKTNKRTYPIEILEIYKHVNLTKAFHFCRIAILTQPYNPNMISNQMHTKQSFMSLQKRLIDEHILA
jgi:hypothetical protein